MPMIKDYLHNKFKHGIEAGVLQYGTGQETTSAEVAEILATADIDFLFVDGEHGGHTVTTILDIARAIAAYDMTPVVRIPQAGTGIIKQLLDGGGQHFEYLQKSYRKLKNVPPFVKRSCTKMLDRNFLA